MFYKSLIELAERMTFNNLETLGSAEDWLAGLPARRRRWCEMLGIADRPRCALAAEETGRLQRDGYVIEKLHYQPLENCRIAANLYVPDAIEAGEKLPAILYVCGHAKEAKTYRNYQGHGRWFARHGYVCMVVDTLWAGESIGLHHGVYNALRYDWISRGYSPAAVEVWSAMRALDYLQGRPEVDPGRLGMTGNSGGGGITWFTAAADERVKVAAPSCQTASTRCHITHRLQDSHCDCTYWINTAGWSFGQMAALLAPRPLMIAAQSRDMLFRPYGYREVYLAARRVYELLGRADLIALQEDHHEHGYTPPQRKGIFNWFEKHLKGVEHPDAEDWDDHVEAAEDLHVFPGGAVPDEDRMKDVGDFFIPLPPPPALTSDEAAFGRFRRERLERLRETTFARIPAVIAPPADVTAEYRGRENGLDTTALVFHSEPHVEVKVILVEPVDKRPDDALLVVPLGAREQNGLSPYRWGCQRGAYALVQTRGTGDTSVGERLDWSIRRGYMLLGLSLCERRIFDTLTALAVIRQRRTYRHIELLGQGSNAPIAAYSALLDADVGGLALEDAQLSELNPAGPELPAVARVGELWTNLPLLHPRPIRWIGHKDEKSDYVAAQYKALGSGDRITAATSLL